MQMDTTFRAIVWRQFGAAIDMLENAMLACPGELWSNSSERPEFWYLVYHTLFFLDLYLTGSLERFAPPAPFTRDELDPAGLLPERPYTKDELQTYLEHGRKKCRAAIDALTDESGRQRCGFEWVDLTVAELLLYIMRHVQHPVSGDVDLKSDLRERFRNITEEYFDDILIASSAGEVLLQKNVSALRITNLNALLPPKAPEKKEQKEDEKDPPPKKAFQDTSQFTNVIDVKLGGTDYKLYMQPVPLFVQGPGNQNLKPIVCGLTSRRGNS